jgi:uncharacterized delta-60 repeat protein
MARSLRTALVGLALWATAAWPAEAAAGDLDPSFSDDGIAVTFPEGGVATAVAVDGEGRIVVAGSTLAGGIDVAIARFLPDGSRDPAFGDGDGRLRLDVGAADHALDLVLLPDDGIAVAGVSSGRRDRPFVVRVGPRGAPSVAFGDGGIATVDFGRPSQALGAIGLTPKGRLVVAGFVSNGTTTRTAVARLLPDGRLDGGFGDGGRVLLDLSKGSEAAHDLLVLDDGRIVLAGEADAGLQPRFLLARLLGSGALDPSFGRSDGVTLADLAPGADVALALARQPDGRYVLAGRAASGDRHDWGVARFGARGILDPTFASGGSTVIRMTDANEEATGVTTQGSRLVVVGRADVGGTLDLAVVRLKSGGVLDPSFGGGDGLVTVDGGGLDTARAVARQPDGSIVVAGELWTGGDPRFLVTRFLAR